MSFDRIIGQAPIKDTLQKIITNGRLSKTYIFYGPEGGGKDAMAIEFAKAINCLDETRVPCDVCTNCRQIGALTHPDLRILYAGSKKNLEKESAGRFQIKAKDPYIPLAKNSLAKILIDSTRELKQFLSLKIFNVKHRVIIISEADRMTEQAANSILKLLEEPPEKTMFILTTSQIDRLLPTIVSRCQVIKFSPLKADEIRDELIKRGTEKIQATIVSRLAGGNFRKAMILLQEDHQALRNMAFQAIVTGVSGDYLEQFAFIETLTSGKNKSMIRDFLSLALLWFRDVFFFHELRFGHPDWEAVLTNFDRLNDIQKLALLLEDQDVEQAIAKTELLVDLVDKNIYINLILIDFMTIFRNLQERVA
ncbi:DNA polymerase III subunit tau [bacterium BMS3Abin05]|nr:DNA polymerase III subunit tau [bacterium BMS3Abin05]GBE28448.1 DNA polymerase III subunit tau [bacterium BMS3Bbin03]